ncbi:hypothetical protein P691DRAFT_228958 [Macrolepiota fuliginosa MF-IS2]|uniref:Uncharacterized protein n=1 Tax=Macrolepiota fuliginosa MF-IS2 TaxID=1400762 RepID=A0A9P6C278_9AGAR|nr:hypothetical protein P691DRAFT_228958 [Macrolepiota fuliginosa MF-IS2]
MVPKESCIDIKRPRKLGVAALALVTILTWVIYFRICGRERDELQWWDSGGLFRVTVLVGAVFIGSGWD